MSSTTIYAEEKQVKKLNILFISSFRYNFISYDNQIRGIKQVLNNNANLKVEYMDLNGNDDKKMKKAFITY